MNDYIFFLPRSIAGSWPDWPPAARAVYPVLLSFARPWTKQLQIFPSRATLALHSGRSLNTVGTGLRWLQNEKFIKQAGFWTSRGIYVHGWVVPKDATDTGKRKAMHTAFFHSGGPWCRLTSLERSVYMALRFVSHAVREEDYETEEVESYFKRRVESYEPISDVRLGRLSGCNRNSVLGALVGLFQAGILLENNKIAVRWPQVG